MRLADRHLVDKCLSGDSAAFGMLVDRYKESVYALAYSRLRNFHDAEDITQEAFAKAYQKLRTLRRWDEFHIWIYAITANLCKDWMRAKSRRPDKEFIEDYSVKSLSRYSGESRNGNTMLEVLHEALDSLPESYQQVLTLHYLGGMDGTEIAEFLGKSPTAIWQRLSRARASLRKEILDMMSDTYEQNRLRAGFTFRIIEIVKRIRIDPVPPRIWPWGFSIATGVIIGILCIGVNVNLMNTESYKLTSSLSGGSRTLDIGEFPVDVMKMPDVTITSIRQLAGDGLGNIVPDMQNALSMAPQAGDTWTQKADMPTARFGLSASTVNGKIYAVGGAITKNGQHIDISTVEEYDPAIDKWTKKTDMPTPREYLFTSTVNGRIYAIGGYNKMVQPTELSIVEEYDPAADKWTKKADIPTPRIWFSSSVVNGKIYAIGGWKWGKEIASVERYDPLTDEWIRLTDMPMAKSWITTGVVNDKIYVIGGGADGIGILIVEEYDPMTDTWTRKTDMPDIGAYYLYSSTVNGKIYVFGSVRNIIPVMVYDPVNDTWTRQVDMPIQSHSFSVSELKGKIYVIGGADITNNDIEIPSTFEYNPGFSGESIDFKGKLPTTWGEVRTASSK